MARWSEFWGKHRRLTSILLWMLAGVFTLACFLYQDKTGPTYPLEGKVQTAAGPVAFKFLRSETIGTDLKIMLLDPVPEGVTGYVKYRRYSSNDDWSTKQMNVGEFEFTRRGDTEKVRALGAELPYLKERAGKYEYLVYVRDSSGKELSVTGDKPVYARYKDSVPMPVLAVHILTIFLSMTFAVRTVMEATRKQGNYGWMMWATVVSLIVGGFIMGPVVQKYAFGVWWSGVPYGFDWTDNKVLVELVAWIAAVVLNVRGRKNRAAILAAGAVTLAVYFIPHSVFGSQYDYKTGTGRGTVG